MDRLTPVCLAAAMMVLAACTGPLGSTAVPDTLKPEGQRLSERVGARGVQIYECRALPNAAGTTWAFVAPEAELLDARGAVSGKHYAGPHWEATGDGSKVVGKLKSRADAPAANAIPWLLLDAKSVGGRGYFSDVTSIQRIATHGGAAPTSDCSHGERARVDYTADYYFFHRP